jgi:hypothetical protein
MTRSRIDGPNPDPITSKVGSETEFRDRTAIQWQLEGGFVDTGDAYLWLIAFVFIEMNFFDWHGEEAID